MTTHTGFCIRAEFADQLTNNDRNSNLIDNIVKEVYTNIMLRQHLLKSVADVFLIKDEFDTWCEVLREAAQEMEDK